MITSTPSSTTTNRLTYSDEVHNEQSDILPGHFSSLWQIQKVRRRKNFVRFF
jgi:hypothetical protein